MRCAFAPYSPGQLKALRTLGLKCDKETGRTEPFEWVKPRHAPRLAFGTRAARLAAMQLLGIRQGECWQRPLSALEPKVRVTF
jgi:hypothetical protein